MKLTDFERVEEITKYFWTIERNGEIVEWTYQVGRTDNEDFDDIYIYWDDTLTEDEEAEVKKLIQSKF